MSLPSRSVPTDGAPGLSRPPAPGGRSARRVAGAAAAGPAGTAGEGGTGAVVAAAVLWATVGPVAALLPAGAGSLGGAAARLLLGGGVLAGLFLRPAPLRRLAARPATRGLLLLALAGMALYQVCFFAALDLTGVAVGTVVTCTSTPVFAGLFAAVRDRRAPSRRWCVGTALAAGANALLVLAPATGEADARGVLCGLLGGAAYATFATAGAVVVRRGADARTVMAVTLLGAGLALVPVLAVTGVGWLADPRSAVLVGYLAAVGTAGAYLLFGRGLARVGPARATSLALVEPAVATLLGLALLGERLTWGTAAGLAVMAAALVTFAAPAGRRWRRRAAPGRRRAPRAAGAKWTGHRHRRRTGAERPAPPPPEAVRTGGARPRLAGPVTPRLAGPATPRLAGPAAAVGAG